MEVRFTEEHLQHVQTVVYDHVGIKLTPSKRSMIYSRLIRRLRTLNIKSFDEYFDLINNDKEEFQIFIDSMTTNLTNFFRENHHFEFLRSIILPQLYTDRVDKIRIWSAGCSMGCEPYSIAMTIQDSLPNYKIDAKILATDISTKVLGIAKEGIYDDKSVSKIDSKILHAYFDKRKVGETFEYKVKPKTQEMITFNKLNLMSAWPMKGPFQVIFCRNVIIYFDKPTQEMLFKRFANLLVSGGYLFLGHSEHIFGMDDVFMGVGPTTYKKIL